MRKVSEEGSAGELLEQAIRKSVAARGKRKEREERKLIAERGMETQRAQRNSGLGGKLAISGAGHSRFYRE
jgi:hypothetical protein